MRPWLWLVTIEERMVASCAPRPKFARRVYRRLFALIGWLLFRVQVSGLENLPLGSDGRPMGGWICCGLPHRTWVEPFLMLSLLPAEPYPVIMADGRTATGSWWRRLLAGMVVEVIPIRGRGSPRDFAGYSDAVRRVIAADAVFVIFPEVGSPSRPPAFRRLSAGIGHFATATGAATVPIVFGGTHELYFRRRIEVRVLPALDPPDEGLESIDFWLAELQEKAEKAAADAHDAAEANSPWLKLGRWLTGPYPSAD